jgi:hypothetical protein
MLLVHHAYCSAVLILRAETEDNSRKRAILKCRLSLAECVALE